MLKFHHETFEGSLAIVKTTKNRIVQNLVSDDIEFVNLIVKEYVLNRHTPYKFNVLRDNQCSDAKKIFTSCLSSVSLELWRFRYILCEGSSSIRHGRWENG